MVECLPSKQKIRVRFPLPGPYGQVAQLAVQLICNQQVAGSIPVLASNLRRGHTRERWTRSGAGDTICGCGSVGRAFDCHSKGRGFKSRQPLQPSFPRESKDKGAYSNYNFLNSLDGLNTFLPREQSPVRVRF